MNDDFLFWLKTKGINWLLAILVVACAVMFYNLYRQRKQHSLDSSWADMSQATLPQSFDEVAKKHGASDPVALFAWLMAAEAHMRDVQTGYIGGAPTVGPGGVAVGGERLTPEARAAELDSADAYFAKVIEGAKSLDENPGNATYTISALIGRAAVAESKGDIAAAKGFLEQAKGAAEPAFPKFAAQAQARIDTLDLVEDAVTLPSRASLPPRPDPSPVSTSAANELLNSVLVPSAPTPPALPPELLRSTQPPAGPPPAQPQGG